MDDTEGYIHDGQQVIFPSDEFGNYFYIRLNKEVRFDNSQEYKIADLRQSVGVVYNCILVACCRNVDMDILLQNLLSTLGNYQTQNIKLDKLLYISDDVLLQELAKMKGKENIDAALQKLPDDMDICCIHFTFIVPYVFQSMRCIENPCEPC